MGKKEMNMTAYKSNFFGRFTNYPKGFPIDFERYEKEKDEATLKAFEPVMAPKNLKKEILFNIVIYFDKNKISYNLTILGELLGVDKSTISRYMKEMEGR